MKLANISLALLACASSASAQYFSEGWAPGKPTTQVAPAATPGAGVPEAEQPAPATGGGGLGGFDLTRILEMGPFKSLFDTIGINITQSMENVRAAANGVWDERIPFITDDNYDAVIVNETLTKEEEENRTWFVLITAQTAQRGGISKFLDESFDSAYNQTLIAGDLPDVRFARIDYMNVTYLTSKWNIWQAPYIVVIRDRGQTLYFFQATRVRLTGEIIREFLLQEQWRQSQPWKSIIAPGGNLEKYMHYYATASRHIYRGLVWIPKWMLMFISGGIASLIMPWLHRAPKTPTPAKTEEKPAAIEPAANETTGASSSTPKKSAKSRKGGKK
ncbi:hypothetical protein BXZ70DRAFT_1078720 [Cristinia sonorae]|uniref:Uncharacterized protein n=1 Tax=Cristinia sonorae TaxID=1940300 RepID=A0A8K0XNB7_9AGAR|nr:hypothetical protein BXZ70DRAFT_1078720 [Cristinia sonorae]